MDAARVPTRLIPVRRATVRRTEGPRRSGPFRPSTDSTRIVGAITVLILAGSVAGDLANDRFWAQHALITGLAASLLAVAVTAAVLNEVLERRRRERWSVLAQYALWDLSSTARLVWASLVELASLDSHENLEDVVRASGAEVVLNTPRFPTAVEELLVIPERREQLHRLITRLDSQSHEALGRWADVMVNSGAYAEIFDRHVELYSLLYWWGSVLDETDPLEEHLGRPRLSRVSLATRAAIGPVEERWLRDNLVAIAQRAESLDRVSFELAMRIVPIGWWAAQLPDRPSARNSRPAVLEIPGRAEHHATSTTTRLRTAIQHARLRTQRPRRVAK